MKNENILDAIGMINEEAVQEAKAYKRPKSHSWAKWGAMAACFALVLSVGIPYLSDVFNWKGGPGQDDPLRPENVIELSGAYYEALDMTDTLMLDEYGLPHTITEEMVGADLGKGMDADGEWIGNFYQYIPYAEVSVTDGRACRAVYIYKEQDSYTFSVFRNYIRFDTDTHEEISEMFTVYGVDDASDIANIRIDDKIISDPTEVKKIFDSLCIASPMGYKTFDDIVGAAKDYTNGSIEIRIETTSGVVVKDIIFYPAINFIEWGLNYYELDTQLFTALE